MNDTFSSNEKKTILIVDDEVSIIGSLKKILEMFGYRVMSVIEGYKSVEIFREHNDNIDLILLDYMMPGMDGMEIFLSLKEIDDEVKVIFMSGYSQDINSFDLTHKGIKGFLGKPFRMRELSNIISETLK